MSSQSPLVIAVGQTFPDLVIEAEELAKVGAVIVDGRRLDPADPTWAEASGVLLGTAARLDPAAIERLNSCKGIVRYGVGYDNVDVAAAKAKGITVAIVREYCVDEVAEHAVAFALTMCRALPVWDRRVRAGQWRGTPKPAIHRLADLCFGVVGFGLIGRAAAQKAMGLYGRVLAYDAWLSDTAEYRAAGYEFADSLDTLLSEADVVTLHLPLTPDTNRLFDAERLHQMKSSAYLINVSRGGIVDEGALLSAVRDGTIAGAALDAFESEPVGVENPLLAEPRILVSPHVAWLSNEAEIDLRRMASAELGLILEGKAPTTPV
jgi:D-3-phosphoglycerate dehydrogenase / 2-oxoglutarate reductase